MHRSTILAVQTAIALLVATPAASQSTNDFVRTADGMTIYFGVLPGAMVKGHAKMRSGAPNEYHVVVAIYEAATGARVSDASVTAQMSGLALAGATQSLERMEIAGTITYGGFFRLPGRDLYTVKVAIERTGSTRPVTAEFAYDLRR